MEEQTDESYELDELTNTLEELEKEGILSARYNHQFSSLPSCILKNFMGTGRRFGWVNLCLNEFYEKIFYR
jgi:hypothetical protein